MIPVLTNYECWKQRRMERRSLETYLYPRPGPGNASGLYRETLLVSVELGGGAATGHLVTNHQGGEREGRSNQRVGLRVACPDAPSQSGLHIQGASARLFPSSAS